MNLEALIKSLNHVQPDEKQIKRIETIRAAYVDVANALYRNCPNTKYTDEAVTSLEMSAMRAVKSIVLEDKF